MNRRYDIAALGELLIDFTMTGSSEQGNPIFERNPGGGPANMICAAAKLGARTIFLTKVGNDMFGNALREIIQAEGVDASQVLLSEEQKTTLAFVQISDHGERSFSFYRKNAADTCMLSEEFDLSILSQASYFFFSSVLMAEGSSRSTSFELAGYAKDHGAVLVYDPNLRPNLWEADAEMKEFALKGMEYADIVKTAEEELLFLMGISAVGYTEQDLFAAVDKFFALYPVTVLLVTLGGKGCLLAGRDYKEYITGFPVAKPVDTTAAGDSFTGGFVSYLVQQNKPFDEMKPEDFRKAVITGNAVGSLTVQKKGAISALPLKSEVEMILHE